MAHEPDFAHFVELAERSTLVTVYRRLANDSVTPVSAFFGLDNGRNTFLLESVISGEQFARYSFVAIDSFLRFEAFGRDVRVTPGALPECAEWSADGRYRGPGDPLHALEGLIGRFRAEHVPGLPRFCGGAVGYVGYDAVRYTENLPHPPPDDRGLPDLAFDFYDSVVIFDRVDKTIVVTAHARIAGTDEAALRRAYDAACRRVDALVGRLQQQVPLPINDIELQEKVARGFDRGVARGFDRSNFATADDFTAAVRRCQEYISAGDIFQVVISQRFETETPASPFSVYRALRVINPSPFMFYLRTGATTLVGCSPEIMVRVEDGEVTVRPLAGTRRRGSSAAEDAALSAELLADPKERAEHIMLVDLGRNDVGRVSEFGSVRLSDLMTIERYSHVMHITSNVTGRLAADKTAFDALRSCLPAGTVSGAPKVRAMEIIDEIEPCRRGPYAGAVGYIDFTGNMETCLALRTVVFQTAPANRGADRDVGSGGRAEGAARKVYIQAGAGVVYDSVPDLEYAETVNKAKGLFKAIEVAEGWRYAMSSRPVEVLSCIQPTGEMHIGNYFGAVANWVALQDTRRCVFGVVDLHSMTMPYDPVELRKTTERMVVDLLACGIDPDKSTLFVQSLVPEHTELGWILGCVCPFGDLRRMTQFKEKSEQAGDFVSAGLFSYPVLQAADILIYRAKYVPVGKDQEQHLELTRVIARRFNEQFKTDFFPEPQPLFTESAKIMSLADPERKMSKSAGKNHYVGLFEDEKAVRDKVKVAVTDSGSAAAGAEMSPGVANLFAILKACGRTDVAAALLTEYQEGKRRYSDLKGATADALVELTGRLRARRAEILSDPAAVQAAIQKMSERAREIARETVQAVRELTGLPPRA